LVYTSLSGPHIISYSFTTSQHEPLKYMCLAMLIFMNMRLLLPTTFRILWNVML